MFEMDLLFSKKGIINNMEHFYTKIGEDWFTYPNLYRDMVKKFNHAKFLEVGSWKGRSVSFLAVEIKNSNKNIHIHCVDTWAGSSDHHDYATLNADSIYHEFLSNIDTVKDIITPIKLTSMEAVQVFPDEYFDFIFIDASHQYTDVMNDLIAWYPKVKTNGVFAGHDYGTWDGVTQAVNEWSELNNLQVIVDPRNIVGKFLNEYNPNRN